MWGGWGSNPRPTDCESDPSERYADPVSGPRAEGPAAPECTLCAVQRHLYGTPPLGPPVRTVEMPGVFGPQPICVEHFVAWKALDDPDDPDDPDDD